MGSSMRIPTIEIDGCDVRDKSGFMITKREKSELNIFYLDFV